MKVLVYGFKHAGKTSFAKELAKALGVRFIDIDDVTQDLYAEETGELKTPREIYSEDGRKRFRELERQAIDKVSASDDFVLAGAPVHRIVCDGFDERIFLDTPRDVILKRIEESGRPAFFSEDRPIDEELDRQMEERRPAYLKAMTILARGDAAELKERVTRPKICVPIRASTSEEICRQMKDMSEDADAVEIWLDHLEEEPDFERMLESKRHMLIAVAKTPEENGRFAGAEEDRMELLLQAARNGANFIDIGRDAGEDTINRLVQDTRDTWCRLIVSHHDFNKTPEVEELKEIAGKMHGERVVCKIATHANKRDDTLSMLELLAWFRKTHPRTDIIITAMGRKGRVTRIVAPMIGSMLAFASAQAGQETAEGQMTVQSLRKIQEAIWHDTD